jgi:hypothetical protein
MLQSTFRRGGAPLAIHWAPLHRANTMLRSIGFLAIALLVAACSTSTAGSGGGGAPAAGGFPSDACTLLSSSEVSTAAGFAVGAGAHPPGSNALTCHWDGPADTQGNGQYIELALDPGAVQYNVFPGSPVPGLGHDAYVQPSTGSLMVKIGSNAFWVYVGAPYIGVPAKQAIQTALVKLVIPRLGG